jgi:hypothetical protein
MPDWKTLPHIPRLTRRTVLWHTHSITTLASSQPHFHSIVSSQPRQEKYRSNSSAKAPSMSFSFSSMSLVLLLIAIPTLANGYEYVHVDVSHEFSRTARICITVLFGLVFASLSYLSWRRRPVQERRLVAFLGSWLMILLRKLFEHSNAPPFLLERGVLVEPVLFLWVSMWMTALIDVGRDPSVESKSFGSTFPRSTLWIPTPRKTKGEHEEEQCPWIYLSKTMGSSLFLTGSISAMAVSVKAYDDIQFTDFALDMVLPVLISAIIGATVIFVSQHYVVRPSIVLKCCGIRFQLTDSKGTVSSRSSPCKHSQSPGENQEKGNHHPYEEESDDIPAMNGDKMPCPKDSQRTNKPDYNWESHRALALGADLEPDKEALIQMSVPVEEGGDVTTQEADASSTVARRQCQWWGIPSDEAACLVVLGLLYALNRNVILVLMSTAVVLALWKALLHFHASHLERPMPSMAATPETIYNTIASLDHGCLLWHVSLMIVTSGWSDTGVPQAGLNILLGRCAEQISTGGCQTWTTVVFGLISALLSPLPAVLVFGDAFVYANPYNWMQLAFAVSIGGSLCLWAGESRPWWARGTRARRLLWITACVLALIVGSTVLEMFHSSLECSELLGECDLGPFGEDD